MNREVIIEFFFGEKREGLREGHTLTAEEFHFESMHNKVFGSGVLF